MPQERRVAVSNRRVAYRRRKQLGIPIKISRGKVVYSISPEEAAKMNFPRRRNIFYEIHFKDGVSRIFYISRDGQRVYWLNPKTEAIEGDTIYEPFSECILSKPDLLARIVKSIDYLDIRSGNERRTQKRRAAD